LPAIVTANATDSHAKVRRKIESILSDPAQHDPVFKSVTRIFNFKSKFNLTRPLTGEVANRFALGYPPRKLGDTSIGDAINWEWIIWCAQNSVDNHHSSYRATVTMASPTTTRPF
jgi:hypothetical protein